MRYNNGKRIICKHIVATYFTTIPKEAINFEEEQNKLQKEYEEYQYELYDKVRQGSDISELYYKKKSAK